MKFQFPYFSHRIPSRLFSSLEMLFLWAFLIGLVTVNFISVQKGRPAHWDKLMMLFETPLSVERHVDLASFLWQLGNKQDARDVLGATTTSLETVTKWEQEEKKIDEQYTFWKSVTSTHPDYRDAFITLTSLAYQLGNIEEAHAWLAKAVTLDPNSLSVQKLREHLQ